MSSKEELQDRLYKLEDKYDKLLERVKILEDRNPPFKKPTQHEVQEYFNFKSAGQYAEDFFNFYESKGWMVGKNKMKDWKRAATKWISTQPKNEKSTIFDL